MQIYVRNKSDDKDIQCQKKNIISIFEVNYVTPNLERNTILNYIS